MTSPFVDVRTCPSPLISIWSRLAIAVTAALVLVMGLVASTSEASLPKANVKPAPMRSITCKPLKNDPALEAPGYAQRDGAGSGDDEWWCQLPHATKLPADFIPFQRAVFPTARHLYGMYSTLYVEKGSGATQASGIPPGQPEIEVSPEFDSAESPGQVARPQQKSGERKVTVAKGVVGTVTAGGGTVSITWPYPTKGVPRYLHAVASVTVTGVHIPEFVVLAIARHVEPD